MIYVIVVCLIVLFIFTSANEGLYAQNNSAVQKNNMNSTDTGRNNNNFQVLTISTNKPAYLPGETIIITGTIFWNTPKPVPADIPVLLRLQDSMPPPKTFNSAFVTPTNGSFSYSSFSAPQALTQYVVTAEPQHGNTANVRIEVVNPLFTIQSFMLMLGFVCFVGLIVVILYSGKINFAKGEILRFVLISGIVASPIVGLLFSDSELGINSPISLIIKPENKGVTNTESIWKNQWFIAVGGMKIDNYASGILIPIYVVIFGLAGGYLRYLYNTSTKLWHLNPGSDGVGRAIRRSLFDWDKIPKDEAETEKFKSFLIQSLGAEWILDATIQPSTGKNTDKNKLEVVSKDKTNSITIQIIQAEEIALVRVGDIFYSALIVKQQDGHRVVYQTIGKDSWSFYQSLTDLALLLLSPLLAIAAWFLLTRGGDINKYIVALVSFTVGLATYSIISALTDFTTARIRSQTTSNTT